MQTPKFAFSRISREKHLFKISDICYNRKSRPEGKHTWHRSANTQGCRDSRYGTVVLYLLELLVK